MLDNLARTLNPIYQSEWAIDLSFRTPEALRRLYPRLLQHAITTFGSTDVMRFLGRHMPLSGDLPKRFTGQVVSDLHQRQEGVRIKHRLNDNSVKLYDKAFTELGCLLRAEATFNSVNDFRCIDPRKATPRVSWPGARCGGASPTCTAVPKCPAKPPNATWMRWPASMRTPLLTTSCTDLASPRTGMVGGCARSSPSRLLTAS